jgi:hypothetical protein
MADHPVSPLRTYHVWQSYRFEAEPDTRSVALVDELEGFDTYLLKIEGNSLVAFRLAGAVMELALAMRAAEDAAAELELHEASEAERARLVREAAEIAKDYALGAIHRQARDDKEPF